MKQFNTPVLLMVMLLSGIKLNGQVLPQYVPAADLSVFYPLDGTGNDLSANGMHATTFGVVAVSNRHGEAGKALQFNGTNTSYLMTQNPSSQMLDAGTGSFSISVWFRTNATGVRTLVNKRQMSGTTNLQGYSLFLDNGKVKFHLADANQANTLVNCTTSYNDNEWHHVVAIRNAATAKVYIYVDNILEYMANDNSGSSLSASADLYAGRWLNYNSYGFSGALDDMGIWKRALTLMEIEDLFRACSDSIQQQPVNQSVVPGQAAAFSLAYSMANAEYQWQSDNGFGFMDLSDAGQYQGVNTASLTIHNVHAGNFNQLFRCIVKGSGCVDTTQTAMLTLDVSGVGEGNQFAHIDFAPNPTTNGYVTLRYKDLTQIRRIEIITISGEVMKRLAYEQFIDGLVLVNERAGVYLIRLQHVNGSHLVKRVVVF